MFFQKIIQLILLCIGMIFFNISTSFAQDPPKLVYRLDRRPPDVIFREGFRSWGNNRSIRDHITGRSCAGGLIANSAFISTTDNHRWMLNGTLMHDDNRIYYIYVIRADENFYSASTTLHNYGTYNPDFERIRAGTVSQREWFTDHPITRDMVLGVWAYTREMVLNRQNPRLQKNLTYYIQRPTQANSRSYPTAGQNLNHTDQPLSTSDIVGTVPPVSACFLPIDSHCSKPGPSGNKLKIAVSGRQCIDTSQVIQRKLPPKSYSEGGR